MFLGAGFLLEQLEILAFSTFLATWWPMLVILLGALLLVTRTIPILGAGLILIFGVFFQIGRLEIFPFDVGDLFWPTVLILLGVWLIFFRGRSRIVERGEDDLDYFVLFSGLEELITSTNFQGGRATTLFGGLELDLSQASMSPEGATLDVTCAFGGTEITIPKNWQAEVTGLPLFGGWDNKAKIAMAEGEEIETLKVRCFVAFGGVEVHH
jgi:hypothetical protein